MARPRYNEPTHRGDYRAVRARSGYDAHLPLRARKLDRCRHLLDRRRQGHSDGGPHGNHAPGRTAGCSRARLRVQSSPPVEFVNHYFIKPPPPDGISTTWSLAELRHRQAERFVFHRRAVHRFALSQRRRAGVFRNGTPDPARRRSLRSVRRAAAGGTPTVVVARGAVARARRTNESNRSPCSSACAVAAAAALAFADTLRCGSSLIQEGDTQGYVQDKCGEPDSKQTYTEPVYARARERHELRSGHHQQGRVALQAQQRLVPRRAHVRERGAEEARVREIDLIRAGCSDRSAARRTATSDRSPRT